MLMTARGVVADAFCLRDDKDVDMLAMIMFTLLRMALVSVARGHDAATAARRALCPIS